MIQNIIFDFGDVFINLNKTETVARLSEKFGAFELSEEMISKNDAYEMGLLTTEEFVAYYQSIFPKATETELIDAWNAIMLDIPEHRLEFIEALAAEKKYKLFLLSNTNDLHIQYTIATFGEENWNRFKACFDVFYLSYEINFRKPNANIFEFVLNENNLNPAETLFIDDTLEHITTAKSLGIQTWNLIPDTNDITDLFDQPFDFKK